MEIERDFKYECRFPALTGYQNKEHQITLTVLEQGENLHALRLIADDDVVALDRLLQISWALVLSKYTGSQTVSFGVIRRKSENRQFIEQKVAVIDSKQSISDAVTLESVAKWETAGSALHELVNTCLILKDGTNSPSFSSIDISMVR